MSLSEAKQHFPSLDVRRELRVSGQKSVFEAWRGGEHLALKVFGPGTDIERVEREIEAMTTFSSRHVARVVEFQQRISQGQRLSYLLEEFIEGQDLAEVVRSRGALPWQEVARMADELLEGLGTIWEQRIVHRDIKPQNIIWRVDGTICITDFGIARFVDRTSLTPTGAPTGPCTPPYAPPEVLSNRKREVDTKSDLYSLGVTLYEVLVGQHPYWDFNVPVRRNIENVIRNNISLDESRLVPIPEALRKFVLRLMSPLRLRRFKDPAHARWYLRRRVPGTGAR